MPDFSITSMPVVFVSNTRISKAVSAAMERGQLRKLGTRLYTRDLEGDPGQLVRRNWYNLITAYYPDALITDRTALENQPAADGSVCLISSKKRKVTLPGLVFRPRAGPAPLESDLPFMGGARLASTARAYLENMRPSRARGELVPRTLSRAEIEFLLDKLLRNQGAQALNRLRDEARAIAHELDLASEFDELNALIGAMLGTWGAQAESEIGKARLAGNPYDPDRIELFEVLFAALRATIPSPRQAPSRTNAANANLSFFESYFSNYIEGTEFTVEEAEKIIFQGVIPTERPQDAHDILGTYRIVSDSTEMSTLPNDVAEFEQLLRRRHAAVMEGRPEALPGEFKTRSNRAGDTVFVEPELVRGTLGRGFEFVQALAKPFQRAVFMMFLVAEVHPFTDGNGRIARIMMNAELIFAGEERVIIPTAYRTDYLDALKAISHNALTEPLIRMLDYAQRYTNRVDWSKLATARRVLERTGAFSEGANAQLRIPGIDTG